LPQTAANAASAIAVASLQTGALATDLLQVLKAAHDR